MRLVPVIVLALFATAAVIAQSGMRPGQWETTTQMQMANMPAGFQMPSMKNTVCITPDQAKDPANAVPRQAGRGRGGKDGTDTGQSEEDRSGKDRCCEKESRHGR